MQLLAHEEDTCAGCMGSVSCSIAGHMNGHTALTASPFLLTFLLTIAEPHPGVCAKPPAAARPHQQQPTAASGGSGAAVE